MHRSLYLLAAAVLGFGTPGVAFSDSSTVIVSEHFGNIQSQGCDSSWVSACEQDWTGYGDDASLSMCIAGSDYGVGIRGGGDANGLYRSLSLPALQTTLEVRFDLQGVVSDGEITGQIVFYNSEETEISSQDLTVAFSEEDLFSSYIYVAQPDTATSADVEVYGLSEDSMAVVTAIGLSAKTDVNSLDCAARAAKVQAALGNGWFCVGVDMGAACRVTCSGAGVISIPEFACQW